MRLYQNYCKISYAIIKKYETFNKGGNKNFTIFKCLRNLSLSNKEILKDLISIINEKDKKDKASKLIEYYTEKKNKYYKNNPGSDLVEETKDEENWFQEVLKREGRIKGEKEIMEDKKEDKKEEKKVEKKVEKMVIKKKVKKRKMIENRMNNKDNDDNYA